MNSLGYGLSKNERICNKKDIDLLFKRGCYLKPDKILLCYHKGNSSNHRIMVSVPKRLFKRAVKRNLIRRRIKEAYRLQKHKLTIEPVDMLFIYKNKELLSFQDIFTQVSNCIDILNTSLDATRA